MFGGNTFSLYRALLSLDSPLNVPGERCAESTVAILLAHNDQPPLRGPSYIRNRLSSRRRTMIPLEVQVLLAEGFDVTAITKSANVN
jgi:hypothetical protein